MRRQQKSTRFSGNINYATNYGINGWLNSSVRETNRIPFFLFIDGIRVGKFAATRVREKIDTRGMVRRRLGFHIPIDRSWKPRERSIVVVQPCDAPDFQVAALFETEAPGEAHDDGPPERRSDHNPNSATEAAKLRPMVVHGSMQDHILPILKHHTGNKDWPAIADLNRALLLDVPDLDKSLLLLGRGSLYAKAFEDAQRTLSIACLLYPDLPDAHYYCGVSYLRAGEYEEAAIALRRALALEPASLRCRRDLGDALARSARRLPRDDARSRIEEEALELFLEVVAEQPTPEMRLRTARLAFDQSRFEVALAHFEAIVESDPRNVPALTGISRCLVGLRRISEALRMAKRITEIDPNNETARYQLRVLRFLEDDDGGPQEALFGTLATTGPDAVLLRDADGREEHLPLAAGADALASLIAGAEATWLELRTGDEMPAAPFTPAAPLDTRFGCHHFREDATGAERVFWNRDALSELVRSVGGADVLARLGDYEELYLPGFRAPKPGDRVLVMSRHGIVKFGGGEHFIESMSDHYRSIGLDPIIVGVSAERAGETGWMGERQFAFVSDNPTSLRALVLETGATLVHGISGTGMLAATALEMMNVQFVYGVHFWREALGSDAGDAFFDEAGAPIARQEFEFVLTRASTVYANSHFTRQVLETAFGVRCPVVYSVPRDLETAA